MLKITLKSILDNKIRFFLTTLTVTMGVTFVVASFAVADSLRDTFEGLSADINEGTDAKVRADRPFGGIDDSVPLPVSLDYLDDIRAVDGVASAAPTYFVFDPPVYPTDGSGNEVRTFNGPPTAALNWTEDEVLAQMYLIEGERPEGLDEFAVGPIEFADFDFVIGETYTITLPEGTREMQLSGVMQFGFPDNAAVGAVLTVFDQVAIQQLMGFEGVAEEINVRAEDGVTSEELVERLQAALDDDVEVITGQEATDEFNDAFGSIISVIQTVLLVFAFVVLFVSTFIINNTFNIILGQRIRELGLLRAIGATGKQIRRSVLGEALVVGIVATIIGLLLGFVGALAIRALIEAAGGSLPDAPLPLRIRTVIWAVALGVGFTLLASLVPAYKASRIPPIAALRSDGVGDEGNAKLRYLFGGLLAVLGIALTAFGLFGASGTRNVLSLLGGGAVIIFLAIAILAPLFAGQAVSALASPLPALFGSTGTLARGNARRSPRRTASTAIALTIGLALVTLVSVVASSLKESVDRQLQQVVAGDFLITSEDGNTGLQTNVVDALEGADGIATVVPERSEFVQILGEESQLDGVSLDTVDQVFDFQLSEGSFEGVDVATSIAIARSYAEDNELALGSTVPVTFFSGVSRDLSVTAIYDEDAFYSYIVDNALLEELGVVRSIDDVVVNVDEGLTEDQGRAAIEAATAGLAVNIQTRDEVIGSFKQAIDIVLGIATVFLGLALFIALIGIVNTLTLSVFERTREIGLLRAVGMTRRQARRMIRWEAVVIALFGALLGVLLGVAFGAAIVGAVPESFIDRLTMPWGRIIVFVVVAVLFGLIAAIFPARRASKMKVLDAIATG